MNPVPCRRVADDADPEEPGEFRWHPPAFDDPLHIVLNLPGGIGTVVLRVHRAGQTPTGSPSWLWDGDRERPTLEPSINSTIEYPQPRGKINWHGHLKAGVLTHV